MSYDPAGAGSLPYHSAMTTITQPLEASIGDSPILFGCFVYTPSGRVAAIVKIDRVLQLVLRAGRLPRVGIPANHTGPIHSGTD
jgi:hypothetical protein